MQSRLRLYSGLILFLFVTGHFVNHSFGLISLDLMSRAAVIFSDPWQSPGGTILLYGAFAIHAGVALWTLWQRRTLKMQTWEAVQLIAGLLAPLILAGHVAGTRGLSELALYKSSYPVVLHVLWNIAPWRGILQAVAVCIIWAHSCVGLHHWLKLKPFYQRFIHVAYSFALVIPTLALAGYLGSGIEVQELSENDVWVQAALDKANLQPAMADIVANTEVRIQTVALILIGLVLIARVIRSRLHRLRRRPKLHYSPGDRVIDLVSDATLLESIRAAGIPHASVCGGRGRCSTCRVRVSKGLEDMPPPDDAEQRVLSRITEAPSVRLACQLRPTKDLEVSALVRANAQLKDAAPQPGYRQGTELTVAFMFVDLRGSTKLSEQRLPFDVVFILNQFFAELSLALKETNGHYAQFNGDGLLAIYGLESGTQQGCREAIEGANAMFRRMEGLNDRLRDELGQDLKIGIGIHAGEAVVGSMGPPQSPIVSALGDNVNIAARLEAQTKELGAPLVVSARTTEYAGVDLPVSMLHNIHVKGRDHPLDVYAVGDPESIKFNAAEKVVA